MNKNNIDINREIDKFLNIFLVSDNLNSPEYYRSNNGWEAIDIIEEFELNYNLGNVLKYVIRCRKKGEELKDLKKACYYLQREIKAVEGQEDG